MIEIFDSTDLWAGPHRFYDLARCLQICEYCLCRMHSGGLADLVHMYWNAGAVDKRSQLSNRVSMSSPSAFLLHCPVVCL